MVAKACFLLCASALLVQTISAQCIGNIGYNNGYGNYAGARLTGEIAAAELAGAQLAGFGGCGGYGGYGIGASSLYAPSISASGGGLAVSSASPISPNGISVISENAIEGALAVQGQLPLLAAVTLEGSLPTAGAAGVTYSCGNGQVGISSESLSAAGLGAGGYGLANSYANAAGIANTGLANAIIGAEYAGLNAGLAGARLGSPCGCNGGLYY